MSSTLRKTAEDELQERNGAEHQRVFDPAVYGLLTKVLKKLDKIETELINIREGE